MHAGRLEAPVHTLSRRGDSQRGGMHDNQAVGFNPYRAPRTRRSDYVLVAATLAVTFALVVWALL